jgi:hypothetical protein
MVQTLSHTLCFLFKFLILSSPLVVYFIWLCQLNYKLNCSWLQQWNFIYLGNKRSNLFSQTNLVWKEWKSVSNRTVGMNMLYNTIAMQIILNRLINLSIPSLNWPLTDLLSSLNDYSWCKCKMTLTFNYWSILSFSIHFDKLLFCWQVYYCNRDRQ